VPQPVRAPKLLLTGPPRIGKTTAIDRLVQRLRQRRVVVGGFVTHERRDHGRRVGFVVHDLAGAEAVIAHQDYHTGVRVGRYGVDVPAFEQVGLPALYRAVDQGGIIIIDEIGRMELASAAFVQLIEHIIDGPAPVVASVHVRADPCTDALKQRPDVELLTLTVDNRDAMPGELLARLTCA
jgi:nucleoside-triphosphatase